MGNKIRSGWRTLPLSAALVLLLMTVPAQADIPAAGTLNLHMGSDGTYFRYTDGDNNVTDQIIGAPTRCRVTIDGPLAAVTGTDNGPGLKDNGIGIKSGGSQGTPCSQVDTTEELTVSLIGVANAAEVDLDLELKSNAKVRIEVRLGGFLVGTFEVRSGSSIVAGQGVDGSSSVPFLAVATADNPGTGVNESIANCRNASDSGPDSGPNDNCYLTIAPGFPFDEVKFIPLIGQMSLEGSGDFSNSPAKDTVFRLTSFDGTIGCTSDNNQATDNDGDVTGTIVRYNNLDGSPCVLKPYSLTAAGEDNSITFDVADPVVGGQPAAYEFFLTLNQTPTNPLSANLEYDPAAPYDSFADMPWCTGDPFSSPDSPGSINSSVIPSPDTACIVDVSQNFDGTTTWHGVFTQDIGIRSN